MSAALSGYIADGATHATKFKLASGRYHESYCGRTDSDDLISPVAIFMTYANAPICSGCVVGVESAHSAKGELKS